MKPTKKQSRYKPTWKQPITLTLPADLLAQIDARGDNRSEVVRTDLTAYYQAIKAL
jgi:metal-responsive CopG/Arc/MetJ family transcriptional regulator